MGPYKALCPAAWTQRLTADKVSLGCSQQWQPRYNLSSSVPSKKENPNFCNTDQSHHEPDILKRTAFPSEVSMSKLLQKQSVGGSSVHSLPAS